MSSFFFTSFQRAKGRLQPLRFRALCGVSGALALLFRALVFYGIDRFAVVALLP